MTVKLLFCTPKMSFGGIPVGDLFKHLGIPALKDPETKIVPVSELEEHLPNGVVDKDGNPFQFSYQANLIKSGPMAGFGTHMTKMGPKKAGLEDFQHCVEIDRGADGKWFVNHDFIRKIEGANCHLGTGTPANVTVPVLNMKRVGRPREYWLLFNLAYRTKIMDLSKLPDIKYGMWTLDFPGGFSDLASPDLAKKNAQIELMEEMGLDVDASNIYKTGYSVHNRSDVAVGNNTHMTIVAASEAQNSNQAEPGDMIDKNTRIAIPLGLCFPYVDKVVNEAIFNTLYSLSALQQMDPQERAKILRKI